MSLAGFQRRRRELARHKELEEKAKLEKVDTNKLDYDGITKDEIIEKLKEKGIEHNPKDKKEVLYDLLVGE